MNVVTLFSKKSNPSKYLLWLASLKGKNLMIGIDFKVGVLDYLMDAYSLMCDALDQILRHNKGDPVFNLTNASPCKLTG